MKEASVPMKMQWVDEDYDKPKIALKAKAMFDNIAENVDELAFRKGEILDVIDQNPDGLNGWWLCSLRGRRQGLVPANRLKVLEFNEVRTSSIKSMSESLSSQLTHPSEIYENTSDGSTLKGKRRSWHIMPNKVVTPHKFGDVYLYDLLPSTPTSTASCSSFANSPSPYTNLSMILTSDSFDSDNYDIPKKAVPVTNDRQQRAASLRMDESTYDIPRPNSELSRMTPSSSNSSLLTSDGLSLSLSLSSSNRSSLANMPDYDVPRKQFSKRDHPPQSQSICSLKSIGSENYDIPNHISPKKVIAPIKELPLELSSALDQLSRLQNDAKMGITKLLSFVNPQWRQGQQLEPVLMEVKLAVTRMHQSLHDFAVFAEGALGNSMKAEDKNLSLKLRPLVKALKNADEIVQNALDRISWNIEILQRQECVKPKTTQPPDSLDQLIVVSQTLTEDIRQAASFIQGNALLLFKKTSQTPTNPNRVQCWPAEDSDYVQIETEEQFAKNLPSGMQKNFDSVVRSAEMASLNEPLDQNDNSVLIYYAAQSVTHINNLTQAIDSFLKTVEQNQPPKYFLNFGKFVILSGHNLVCIGDIVVRNLTRHRTRTRILSCSDNLSTSLKNCVLKTKKAAQNFPSVSAVQDMVDSVVDISHSASDLKIAMLQAINL